MVIFDRNKLHQKNILRGISRLLLPAFVLFSTQPVYADMPAPGTPMTEEIASQQQETDVFDEESEDTVAGAEEGTLSAEGSTEWLGRDFVLTAAEEGEGNEEDRETETGDQVVQTPARSSMQNEHKSQQHIDVINLDNETVARTNVLNPLALINPSKSAESAVVTQKDGDVTVSITGTVGKPGNFEITRLKNGEIAARGGLEVREFHVRPAAQGFNVLGAPSREGKRFRISDKNAPRYNVEYYALAGGSYFEIHVSNSRHFFRVDFSSDGSVISQGWQLMLSVPRAKSPLTSLDPSRH